MSSVDLICCLSNQLFFLCPTFLQWVTTTGGTSLADTGYLLLCHLQHTTQTLSVGSLVSTKQCQVETVNAQNHCQLKLSTKHTNHWSTSPLNTQGLTSLAHSDNSQANNVIQVFLELVTWSWNWRALGLV